MTLPAIEIETGPQPRASIIWLHGLGADGNDFVPIAREIGLPYSVRYVFPHAPLMPVTINNGYVMRAWYDIACNDLALREDEAGVRASQAAIEKLIAREMARGIDASNIVLAGFSQGGAIALFTALRHPARLAGAIALSTYLPLPHTLSQERSPANLDLPIFMAHGSADPIVPLTLGSASRTALEQAGYTLEWHEYRMSHSVCAEEIEAIASWLGKTLKGK
ncbi:MAG: alpha/beta fold hydrolase [Pseudomonadota bacterium]